MLWFTLFYPNPPQQQEKGIKQHYFSPWIFTEIMTYHTIIQDYFAQCRITQNGLIILWKPLGAITLGRVHGWSHWACSSRKAEQQTLPNVQIDACSFFTQSPFFLAIIILKLFHKALLMTKAICVSGECSFPSFLSFLLGCTVKSFFIYSHFHASRCCTTQNHFAARSRTKWWEEVYITRHRQQKQKSLANHRP